MMVALEVSCNVDNVARTVLHLLCHISNGGNGRAYLRKMRRQS